MAEVPVKLRMLLIRNTNHLPVADLALRMRIPYAITALRRSDADAAPTLAAGPGVDGSRRC